MIEDPTSISLDNICDCNTKIVMAGHCRKHKKDWKCEIDKKSISELMNRIEKVEHLINSILEKS
jgi:translation initiation factor 2B subunit (eIF-2B alpha/beta/delta family)